MLKDETYQTIPLVLNRGLLERINRAVIEAKINRSAFLRQVIERALMSEQGQTQQTQQAGQTT